MLKSLIKTNPFRFYASLVLMALVPVLSMTNTFLVQQETNAIVSKKWPIFLWINIFALLILFIDYIFDTWSRYLLNVQTQDYNQTLREQIIARDYYDQKQHPASQVQNRLTNDLKMINQSYFINILWLVYGIMTIVSVLSFLILLNWKLLITIVLMVVISLALPKLIEKPLQKATNLISDNNQEYLDVLNDWLSGLDEIQQFLAGAKLFKVTEKASKKLEDANVKQTAYIKLLNAITGIVSAIFGFVLFIITGYLIKNGQVSIGTLLIVGNFRFYLRSGINCISSVKGEMKGIKKLIAKVEESGKPVAKKQARNLAVPYIIKTQNLTLKFPNGEKLSFPDLEIKQGEKILLTGDSGAGKSTLFKLVLGALRPSTGQVIFENKDGQKINPDMSKIGYIPQDPVLFPGSIKDNITMFNKRLDQNVDRVISEVNFTKDIAKFKDGQEQVIDLDNLNISGGQRQKLVLARAKIHDSQIILIDEGTSAIDQRNTMEILKKLLKTKATIVFIAHNFNEGMKELFDREIHLVKE